MNGLTRAGLFRLAALSVLCLALAMPVAALAAAATPTYVKESQQAYEAQLAKGEITAAVFNRRLRSLRLTLKNGEHVLYHYPKKGSPALESALKAKHVSFTVLAPADALKEVSKPKHKLRYIAGGVLILVIVIVGVVLLVNRRRTGDE
jgi:hypothetical protein